MRKANVSTSSPIGTAIGLVTLLAIGHGEGAAAMTSGAADISIDIRVVDPAGKPVPYVTFWGFTRPERPRQNSAAWQQLTLEDLWRISLRYQDSFELAQQHYKPVDGISIFGVTDENGIGLDTVDFKRLALDPRPASMDIGYTFMRRGYLPEKARVRWDAARSRYELKIVLRPRRSAAQSEPVYLQTFDRVRHELADWRRSESTSSANQRRMAELRAAMDGAAAQALAAGDHRAAALIYARMQTMPEATEIDGKVAGYAQTHTESARNRAAILKAIELNSEDGYFAIVAAREKGRELKETFSRPLTDADRARLRQHVLEKEIVFALHAEHAWMFDRLSMFYDFMRSGLYERAYAELRHLREFEPKGADYDDLLSGLEAEMVRKGARPPADWR
jgi:hypothetical protein